MTLDYYLQRNVSRPGPRFRRPSNDVIQLLSLYPWRKRISVNTSYFPASDRGLGTFSDVDIISTRLQIVKETIQVNASTNDLLKRLRYNSSFCPGPSIDASTSYPIPALITPFDLFIFQLLRGMASSQLPCEMFVLPTHPSRFADPTEASIPDLPHGPHSDPVPLYHLLQTIILKPLETDIVFTGRVLEQTVNTFLWSWSYAAFQAHFWYISEMVVGDR
ncbi:unnamed protein product [Protopolystoma xenopodis]|uniref:Uncharacterized protein n=1 Tax=Protopolystoma xenopodis TaxID=117903 RepID=A0A3S5A0S6_9PLAT|nr:unnamed protein product [Protopolystoma xenopodis]